LCGVVVEDAVECEYLIFDFLAIGDDGSREFLDGVVFGRVEYSGKGPLSVLTVSLIRSLALALWGVMGMCGQYSQAPVIDDLDDGSDAALLKLGSGDAG